MKQKIQIQPSGIPLIDRAWGGLYRGGTYLLIGAHKSGRTTLALELSKECSEQDEVCLFFTTRRPKDLIMQASSIGYDIQNQMMQNNVIIIRVDSSINLGDKSEQDHVLADYLQDIIGLVEQYQPSKIIFDELTSFLGFTDLKSLEDVFTKTVEYIEDFGVTSIFILGDPITVAAKQVVDLLASHSTGVIYLQKQVSSENKIAAGVMAITPNLGHSEGKFKSNFEIIPGKGFTFGIQNFTSTRNYSNGHTTPIDSKYKSLSEISTLKDEYLLSNLYSYEDFSLLVNNQIALYKSTRQIFTLVSFKLDEEAIKMGLLSLNQLRNAVRLSIEKKDKLCIVLNKVIVLVSKEDQKDITGLVARVKSNLTNDDKTLWNKIISSVAVYAIQVDESVNSSEELLKELRSDETKGITKLNLS